jgi:methylmalonyl-CoA mutase C-terminal domain/subunit
MEQLRAAGLEHVGVIVGGIIPEVDIPKLMEMGVAKVFGPGTSLTGIVEFLGSRRSAAHA